MWMDTNSELYSLTHEFYYRITNYNPRLLIRCAGCTTENDAEESVLAQVKQCMNEVRKSMELASVARFLESSMLTLLKTGCAGNTPTKVFQLHWCYRYTPGVYA